MQRLTISAAIAAAFALSACATAPGDVQADYVSPAAYRGMSCADLAAEDARISAALEQLNNRQWRTRRVDQVSVAIIGLPLGSLTGRNRSAAIAEQKGAQQTVRAQMAAQACPAP